MDAKKTALKAVAGALPVALVPGVAQSKTLVRFAHAVPGAGEGKLVELGGKTPQTVATATFGTESPYHGVLAGVRRLGLSVGGKIVSTVKARLSDHAHYSVIALAPSAGPKLMVLTDGRGQRGTAKVRVVHAAPEFGSPAVKVDGKAVLKSFKFEGVTPYLKLAPGKHSFAAQHMGEKMPALEADGVPLADGSATTVLVVGTRGQKTRFVLTHDQSAPRRSTAGRAHRTVSKATPAASDASIHVVKSGECLWSIARARLGRSASNAAVAREVLRIWNVNGAHVPSGNPNVIVPGLRLKVA